MPSSVHAWMIHSKIIQNLLTKVEAFTNDSPWQLNLNDNIIFFIYIDIIKNQFLVCEIHISHVAKLMK